ASGATNESRAMWQFSIPPSFHQTSWFYAIVIATLFASVIGIWQLRVRQMRQRFSAVLAERARVGREIHDVLLQNLGGIALEFNNLGRELKHTPALKDRCDSARRQVEACIRETRQSIWDLRSPIGADRDLASMLRFFGDQITSGRNVTFQLV